MRRILSAQLLALTAAAQPQAGADPSELPVPIKGDIPPALELSGPWELVG